MGSLRRRPSSKGLVLSDKILLFGGNVFMVYSDIFQFRNVNTTWIKSGSIFCLKTLRIFKMKCKGVS